VRNLYILQFPPLTATGSSPLAKLHLDIHTRTFGYLSHVDATLLGLTCTSLYKSYQFAMKLRVPNGRVSLESRRKSTGRFQARLANLLIDWFHSDLVYSWHAEKFVAPGRLLFHEIKYMKKRGCSITEVLANQYFLPGSDKYDKYDKYVKPVKLH
jgi:hypothetical protein